MAEGFVLFGSNEPMPEVLVMLRVSCSELQAQKFFCGLYGKIKLHIFLRTLKQNLVRKTRDNSTETSSP